MHVFQISGTVAQGGQVSCPRTHSWVGADTGGSTLSWDHHSCPHTHQDPGGTGLTIDAANLVTHVLTVVFLVTLPAAVDAGPVGALELIRPARSHSWERQSRGRGRGRAHGQSGSGPTG